MDKIPHISEIKLENIVDHYYYKCYPTILHEKEDSPWLFLGMDLRAIKEKGEEYENTLLWGKGK